MNRAFPAWIWSLGVVARSYRTVVVLAAFIALWAFAAYQWLGLPESSGLVLILALIWAIVQLLVSVVILTGVVSAAVDAEAAEGGSIPIRSLWAIKGKKLLTTLIFCLISLTLVWLCRTAQSWINEHSVEVASFLTFHSGKAVSHVLIEKIYNVVELLLWIVLSGFLLSFLVALFRSGWRGAIHQTGKLLAGCTFRNPFLTNLLTVAVFGGLAYELLNWHPVVPAIFWDYTQVIVRSSLALILSSAGILFWSLSLAYLQVPRPPVES